MMAVWWPLTSATASCSIAADIAKPAPRKFSAARGGAVRNADQANQNTSTVKERGMAIINRVVLVMTVHSSLWDPNAEIVSCKKATLSYENRWPF